MKVQYFILISLLLTGIFEKTFAQNNIKSDSLPIKKDTQDTVFEDIINKDANDSINVDIINKKIFLYGKAKIEYKDIKIESGFIEIDWNTNIITAKPLFDSVGKSIQIPYFVEGEESFHAQEIRYNLKTKKGVTQNIT